MVFAWGCQYHAVDEQVASIRAPGGGNKDELVELRELSVNLDSGGVSKIKVGDSIASWTSDRSAPVEETRTFTENSGPGQITLTENGVLGVRFSRGVDFEFDVLNYPILFSN